MNRINKSTIMRRVCERQDFYFHTQVTPIINGFLREINRAMLQDEKVFIRDFGMFIPVQRKARRGMNIIIGKELIIPPYKTVKFKVCRKMKERMNGKRRP